jgi:protein-S-isoprenylcysteine O-methyltransferase Ste14
VFLQVICFVLIFYLIMPLVYFQFFPGWETILKIKMTTGFFLAQLVFLVSIPGFTAVLNFMTAGLGTPFPYDPPQRLVTSGVYAYMINPMQMSTALIYLVLGFLWRDFIFMSVVSLIYSAGLAHWHENAELKERFSQWQEYRKTLHAWWPRWRPSALIPEAKLYYDDACGACQDVMHFFSKRSSIRIKLIPARLHPTRVLMRLTYEAGDGIKTEGVAAFGAGLNHINLFWAFWGWLMQLPVVKKIVQIITDAVGPEPHATR